MRLCVIGDPVGHSLSPRIHRRFMERCGAAGSYEAVTVTAETLEDFVAQGCRGAWDGCNVTMPLKECILPLLDAVEPEEDDLLAEDSDELLDDGTDVAEAEDAPVEEPEAEEADVEEEPEAEEEETVEPAEDAEEAEE